MDDSIDAGGARPGSTATLQGSEATGQRIAAGVALAVTGVAVAAGAFAWFSADQRPEFAQAETFSSFDIEFDDVIPGGLTLTGGLSGDEASLDVRDPASDEPTKTLNLRVGETGEAFGAKVTVCAVWSDPRPSLMFTGSRDSTIYYSWSMDGSTPVCPERIA